MAAAIADCGLWIPAFGGRVSFREDVR